MGYGTGSGNGLPTTYFKFNGLKKEDKPKDLYFIGRNYKDGNWVEIEEKPTFIEGQLVEVTTKKYEYEGRNINSFSITLQDLEGRYVLESGFGMIGVNVINTLANEESIGNVKLSLYTSKKGYPSVFVSVDGNEKPGWKWEYKELEKKMEKIKNKKGEVVQTDRTELEEFLIKYISSKEFQDKIKEAKFEGGKGEQAPEVKPDETPDDLPF